MCKPTTRMRQMWPRLIASPFEGREESRGSGYVPRHSHGLRVCVVSCGFVSWRVVLYCVLCACVVVPPQWCFAFPINAHTALLGKCINFTFFHASWTLFLHLFVCMWSDWGMRRMREGACRKREGETRGLSREVVLILLLRLHLFCYILSECWSSLSLSLSLSQPCATVDKSVWCGLLFMLFGL